MNDAKYEALGETKNYFKFKAVLNNDNLRIFYLMFDMQGVLQKIPHSPTLKWPNFETGRDRKVNQVVGWRDKYGIWYTLVCKNSSING